MVGKNTVNTAEGHRTSNRLTEENRSFVETSPEVAQTGIVSVGRADYLTSQISESGFRG